MSVLFKYCSLQFDTNLQATRRVTATEFFSNALGSAVISKTWTRKSQKRDKLWENKWDLFSQTFLATRSELGTDIMLRPHTKRKHLISIF